MKRLTLQPPVYWVSEKQAVGPTISRGWFIHTEYPYYRGKSVRVRIGDRAVEFGVCWKSHKPVNRFVDAKVSDIREWVGPNGVQAEEGDGEGRERDEAVPA